MARQPLVGQYTPAGVGKVVYGPECVQGRLAAELDALGAKRGLIVSGRTVANETSVVRRVREAMGGRCAGVFDGSRQHNPRSSVLAGARLARELRADCLVAVGGGSPVDCTKGIALVLAEGEDFDRMKVRVLPNGERSAPPLDRPKLPQVSIPTTLSAGEFSATSGITDDETRVKELFQGQHMAARVVFHDPSLTLETPFWLWCSTAIKAVDHAVERTYSRRSQPYNDALCLHALRMLAPALLDCLRDPKDLATRGDLMYGAFLSEAGPSGSALSHAIGHQLGARFDVPHGVTSCILQPAVMRFNRDASAEKQALMARAMGVDTHGMSATQAADAAAERVGALIAALDQAGAKVPTRIGEAGVPRSELDALAEQVMHEPGVRANPRPVRDIGEVRALLEAVW